MNQKYIISAAVVLGLVIAGWYFMTAERAEAPSDVDATSTDEEALSDQVTKPTTEDDLVGSGSLAALFALGKNLKCEFAYVSDETNAASAGTVYISGDKMRGDFEMEQSGQVYTSHMIQDGSYVYTWSQSAQGTFAVKMPVVEGEAEASTDTTYGARPMDMTETVDYSCVPWGVNSTQFVPPADVQFMSMEDMMQGRYPVVPEEGYY